MDGRNKSGHDGKTLGGFSDNKDGYDRTRNNLSSASSADKRRRSHDEVAARVARMAGGLDGLGVSRGDSVFILMRNDIAFIEAAYAAMRLAAYAVPVELAIQARGISLCAQGIPEAPVLIGHADMLHQLRDAIPAASVSLACRRHRKFYRITRSILITSPRPVLRPISKSGSNGNGPMTARCCRNRRT